MPKLTASNKQFAVERFLRNRFGYDIKISILKSCKAYLAFRTKDEIHIVYVDTRTSMKNFPKPPEREQAEQDLDKAFRYYSELFEDDAIIKFDHICMASKEDQKGVLVRAHYSFLDLSPEEEENTEKFD